MKRLVILLLAFGSLAFELPGQGILLWNLANSGGLGATSGGLIFINDGTALAPFDGVNFNVGITLWGGATSNSMSLIGTYTASNDPKGYTGADIGKFQAGNEILVPGVAAGGTAWLELQIWFDGAGGLFPSYNAALVALDPVADVIFANPTSNPTGIPPTPDQQLTGMPTIVLGVPEPSAFSLFGLAAASLLCCRSRK